MDVDHVATPATATTWTTHPWMADGHGVRFGLFGGAGGDWTKMVDWAQRAEALGSASYWPPDHPVAHGRDCWTVLAGLARATTRIRLGTLVTCIAYRHPVLLARIVAAVDRISGGRALSGLGIGDIEPELAQWDRHINGATVGGRHTGTWSHHRSGSSAAARPATSCQVAKRVCSKRWGVGAGRRWRRRRQ